MKRKLITITALAALVSLAGCQQEPVGPERLEGDIEIALQMEDLATKVDIADKTGAGTWTTGDEIAVHVTETGVGTGYRDYTINAAGSYHFTMNANITLDGYVITPSIMCDYADPAPLGSTPRVIYRTEYDMTGRDLTSPTFSYVPMMAVNDDELLYFYHVGGLVRLAMQGVPEGTNKVVVTFDGMTNVTGTCTVSNPGTNRAAATITSGSGNVVTFTNVNRTAANLYLNVPIPTGNYSALTSITVEAFQDATSKGIVRINQRGRWSTVRHGHGRVIPVSFTSNPISGVRLSSTADVTLWKSQKVQRTAVPYDAYGLEYPDATIVWESDAPSIASVHPTTGIVTAVSAGDGPVTITATATPSIGGTPMTATYQVYVNAITGIDVLNAHKVYLGDTKTITATLTNTNNGTPTGLPSDLVVNWVSGTPSKVSVASASTTPVKVDATHMTTTVVVNGVAKGSATLTASVPGYGGISDSDNTVICKSRASITITAPGEKYKFRDYYLSPGVLHWNGSAYDLTSGDDPLELLQHYWYDGKENGFDGTAATHTDLNVFFHAWAGTNSLYHRLHGSNSTTPNVDITATIIISPYSWRIPTGNTGGEWDKIFTTSLSSISSPNITINGTPKSDASYNFVRITVDLADATTENGAAVDYHYNDGDDKYRGLSGGDIGNQAGNNRYQSGVLLIPDGATITCDRISTIPGTYSTTSNCLDWDDLKILTDGGCVFMPSTGLYNGSTWTKGGETGFYWSSTRYSSDTKYAYNMRFAAEAYMPYNYANKTDYYPVHLIHD